MFGEQGFGFVYLILNALEAFCEGFFVDLFVFVEVEPAGSFFEEFLKFLLCVLGGVLGLDGNGEVGGVAYLFDDLGDDEGKSFFVRDGGVGREA